MFFEGNIKKMAKRNTDFRRVVATGPHSQLVMMAISAKDDIGIEVHPTTDQILFIVEGEGKAIVNGKPIEVEENDAVLVPAGAEHNLINMGPEDLKLYTVYSPPEHKPGTVHKRKADALAAERIARREPAHATH